MRYCLPVRVYYEDTDSGGIVYHANYLKFFERARVEAFRTHQIELNQLIKDYDTLFVVRSVEIDYFKPARLDQLLYIMTEISIRYASIRCDQKAYLENEAGTLLCHAKVNLACINSEYRAKGLPEIISKELKK